MSDPGQAVGRTRIRIGPAKFFGIGVFLFALKFALDRAIARLVFGRDWSIVNYLIPNETYALPSLPQQDRGFYLTMLAVAIPFVVVGIFVTLRRLADAQLPRWLAALFFAPVINLLFFAALSVIPAPRPQEADDGESSDPLRAPQATRAIPLSYGTDDSTVHDATPLGRIVPHSEGAAAWVAIFVPAGMGVAMTMLAAQVMRNYGFGLFVGMPFCVGMMSAVIYGFRTPRTLKQSLGIGMASALVAGFLLIVFALEGLGCLIMLLPLAVPIVLIGAAAGHQIVRRPSGLDRSRSAERSLWSVGLTLPLLIAAEGASSAPARVCPITTAIEVNCPPAQVWRNVIAFSEITGPLEWPFRAGVAYPVRARIEGSGVGAARYCEFSTGAFVEPIAVWDPPRLLKFDVTHSPPPMREWSPFNIHPPHMEGFLVSRGGEFRLIELPGGRTRIEGTTWYENRMWPQAYWRGWSDFLIHRIHRRVLEHIKRESEPAAVVSGDGESR